MDNNYNYNNKKYKNVMIFKENFKILTLEFKKNYKYKYNLMRLYLLIDRTKKGYRFIQKYGPNKYGTGFLFKKFDNELEIEEHLKYILFLAKQIHLNHNEINFKMFKRVNK